MFMRLWAGRRRASVGLRMPTTDSITVALIEDEHAIRKGLSVLVNGTFGYRCIGAFGSVEEALRSIGGEAPDVLLLDINLPGMSGAEGARFLNEKYPSTKILMLTVYDEEEKIFESICNGASGYLLKRTPPAELLEAIRELHEGGAPMSPEVARKVVRLFQQSPPPRKLAHNLTPHEVRLLGMLAEGYSYQAAADRFQVSINTIRDYIRSIYDKLHVHSKTAAVRKAITNRIIS